jgi:hypothetical protein
MKNILMIVMIINVQTTLTHTAHDAAASTAQAEKDTIEKAANTAALILARKHVLPLLAEHQQQQWCTKIDYSSYLHNKWQGLWAPALCEDDFQKLSLHELAFVFARAEEKLKTAIPYKPFFSSYEEKEQAYKASGEQDIPIDSWKLEGSEREKAVFIVVCNGIRAAMDDARQHATALSHTTTAVGEFEEQEALKRSVATAASAPTDVPVPVTTPAPVLISQPIRRSSPVMLPQTNSSQRKGEWLDAVIFEKEQDAAREENFRQYELEQSELRRHRYFKP